MGSQTNGQIRQMNKPASKQTENGKAGKQTNGQMNKNKNEQAA